MSRKPERASTHQGVTLLPSQLLAQELDDGLEPVRGGDLVEVLLHNRGVPHRLEPYDDCRDKPDITVTYLYDRSMWNSTEGEKDEMTEALYSISDLQMDSSP